MLWRKGLGVAFVIGLGLAGHPDEAAPRLAEPPPIGAFTDEAEFGYVSISPDGKHLAQFMRVDGIGRFQVLTYPGREPVVNFNLGERQQVGTMLWLSDTRVLTSPRRYLIGVDFLVPTGELYTVDIETGSVRSLGIGAPLHLLPDDPDHILILRYSAKAFAEAHRLNINSGHTRRLTRSAMRTGNLLADINGGLTMSDGVNGDFEYEVRHRKDGERWRLVHSSPYAGASWAPVHFGPTPDTWYTFDDRSAATAGLGLYNSEDNTHELIIRHPKVDVSGLLADFNGHAWAVRFDHHYPAVQYLDKNHPLAAQHAAISKMFPEDEVQFLNYTRDHRLTVAFISGDRRPGDYVLVNLETRKIEPLAQLRPQLTREMLAPMNPVEIRVRDGDTIYGYVTSPEAAERPGPLVVMVHGGPHGIRDFWGFNTQVQLLASRGYHVLGVNFRGSGGYGREYLRKGFGEWGALMQDDVTDATRWAVESGIADAERICVFGGSYGAYSALMGVAREPDLYRCAIGAAGVYDLSIMESSGDVRALRGGITYIRQILRGAQDKPERSPVNLADRIKARVLLMHGGEDRRAPMEHARRMRAALEEAGNPAEWLYDIEQGHGAAGNEPRREMYQRVLDFLAESTGARSTDGA